MLCKGGVPDLLVYKMKDYYGLSNVLPRISKVKVNEVGHQDFDRLTIETRTYSDPVDTLIEDVFFVEVKSWSGNLSGNQKSWIEEYKQDLPIAVIWVKPLDESGYPGDGDLEDILHPLEPEETPDNNWEEDDLDHGEGRKRTDATQI
ncbi:hypothetical protein [Natrinema sp. H-ect4]|uniref:hypothetical protein n=1 Tax=Natrinema sp. H-ect4 TaxID=3242699 RepID=UPI0035A855EE